MGDSKPNINPQFKVTGEGPELFLERVYKINQGTIYRQ
jgi:hypothetical protein